jgi:hypothetical protein
MKIALCLPGFEFPSVWVSHVMNIQAHLLKQGHEVAAAYSYTNNIYITRGVIHEAVMKAEGVDLVLWIDDDNIVSVPNVVRLMEDLEDHPEADAVSAWYWLAAEVFEGARPSVGTFNDESEMVYVTPEQLTEKETFPVHWAGLGCCLMRRSALEKAGERPFRPILGNWELGYTGDDISFFHRFHENGGVMLCDPQVHVPHLKLRCVQPLVTQVKEKAAGAA